MKNNKVRRPVFVSLLAIAAIAVAACSGTPEPNKPAVPANPAGSATPASSPAGSPSGSPASAAPNAKIDALVGKWTGTDSSSLTIAKKGDKFSIDIAGKTGTKSYEGTAKGDAIEFSRDGKTETVKGSTGAETGVKGLEKESNCVVVTKGTEAYCRK